MSMMTPASESLRRSPHRRTKHSQSASSIVISDAIDATDIHFDPRTASSSAFSISEGMRSLVTQPIPSAPKVGPHNFEKLRILGAGSTGRVYLVRSVGLGVEDYYAMKVVKKSELVKRNRVQRILTERQILSVANHPFVVTLHYCFQTADFFYLVMQYCAGGELFSFLRSQQDHRVSEAHARFYAAEVLIALEYLHLIGIIYRDLKPENILVHESGHVMLSDFDLAHEVRHPIAATITKDRTSSSSIRQAKQLLVPLSPTISTSDPELWFRMRERRLPTNRNVVAVTETGAAPATRRRRFSFPCVCIPSGVAYPHMDTEAHMNLGEKRTSFVGTHEYVAPEIIAEEGYIGSVDWWAFGILLYEMVFGVTPFKGQTQLQTLENILDISEEIGFPPDVEISDECKDLIEKLLAKNVTQRLQNPLLIKSHPFFKGLVWPLIRHQQPPTIPAMVHSLQDKLYSEKEMSEFDDEVPFHKALGSPRRRSQRRSVSSLSSGGSTVHLASIAQLSTDGVSLSEGSMDGHEDPHLHGDADENEEGEVDHETLPGSPQSRGECTDSTASTTKNPSPAPSPASRSRKEPMSRSPSRAESFVHPTSPDSVAAANTTAGVVHEFEFVSNQRRSYWSSTDSHQSLTAKLSQLDMALALQTEACDEELDEDDDDGEAIVVDLQGPLAGALGIQ